MNYLISFLNIFSDYFGETFEGHFDDLDNFIPKTELEILLKFLPSILNHWYGRIYGRYLYCKNNLYYLGNQRIENKIYPIIMDIKINDDEVTELIKNFHFSTPMWAIFSYYNFSTGEIKIRYLKNGIVTKTLNTFDIEENRLEELL
jgi:hypothetical protein